VKLHLGCGEQYLEGYRNIDLPQEDQTVIRSVADEFGHIDQLRYAVASIEEVRLHHVFEHFPRPVAIALVASWRSWLKPGGVLHVEVPDFVRTARAVLWPFSSRQRRLVGIRHLFGSHEAPWAVHWEGWCEETLSAVYRICGIEPVEVKRGKWRGTYNVHVLGRRTADDLGRDRIEPAVREWLRNYLVDASPSELKILDVWMDQFRRQLDRTWASAG
jgi:predicted SAM-dependent methyltransferase